MKLRTIYFKHKDNAALCRFWSELLDIQPHKDFDDWKEIMCGTVRLGFLKLDESRTPSNCVPVFECGDNELDMYYARAIALGAVSVIDGRDDPHLLSIVMRDPFGNEFELSKFHD